MSVRQPAGVPAAGAPAAEVPAAVARRVHWPELDVVRGVAAVLMVFSHVAAALFAGIEYPLSDATGLPTGGLLMQLTWYGGAAPMLFFFVTGLGYGVKGPIDTARSGSRWRGQGFGDLMIKAAILFAADALMWMPGGHLVGLDFFGFIAVSMVVLWVVRALPGAPLWAAALAGLVLGLRYAFAPVAGRLLGPEHADTIAMLDRAFGNDEITAISFPLGPWLVVPLVGFLIGRWMAASRSRLRPALLLLFAGLLAMTGSYAFAASGGTQFYRWGVLSLPYLVGGLGFNLALLGGLIAWFGQERLGGVGRLGWLSLRGIAAFLVVPLHFMIIALGLGLGLRGEPFPALNTPGPWLWVLGLPALMLWLAPLLARLIRHVCGPDRKRPARRTLATRPAPLAASWIGIVAACAALAVLLFMFNAPGWIETVLRSLGQLALCALLVLPLTPVPAAAPRTSAG